jgi:hypothetical protein
MAVGGYGRILLPLCCLMPSSVQPLFVCLYLAQTGDGYYGEMELSNRGVQAQYRCCKQAGQEEGLNKAKVLGVVYR